MSSIQGLRKFVSERLTAAAEEILGVFEKTIVVYEEEIVRQRRLLDIVLKPEIKLYRTECYNQDRKFFVVQADSEPPQIKEEQEELSTSEEGEHLVLKQETATFMLIPTTEGSDNQTLSLDPNENHRSAETEPPASVCIRLENEPEANRDQQLPSHNVGIAVSHNRKRGKCGRPTKRAKKTMKGKHVTCDTCSKVCNSLAALNTHKQTHSTENAFKCGSCDKAFKHKISLTRHSKTHTGKPPYGCRYCGRHFRFRLNRDQHIKSHTDDKPYLCGTCGLSFQSSTEFKTHMKIHAGELHVCEFCGKSFALTSYLIKHLRVHTVERPYECLYCRRTFRIRSDLTLHSVICSLKNNARVLYDDDI